MSSDSVGGNWGRAVRDYRAFLMGANGSVIKRHDFTLANDADALEHAQQYVATHDVEVWQLHRLVGRLRHSNKAA
jgi:hypothetical protein